MVSQRCGKVFVSRTGTRVLHFLQATARVIKKRTAVRVNGRIFIAPVVDGQVVKIDELWMGPLLRRLIDAEAGAFVDVGANMGQTLLTLRARHHVPYFGFEPNPACVCYVRELINHNRLQDCVLFPTALGESNEVRSLYTRALLDTCATIVPGFRPGADSQPVPVSRGDDVLSVYAGAIQMVKVDVEDGELEALRGLDATLRRHSPYVLCEILPVCDGRTEIGARRLERQCRLLSYMGNLGYRIFRVQMDGGLLPIHEIEIHSDLKKSNYVFVPSGRPLPPLAPTPKNIRPNRL